tara:strand:+ start:65 stop:445 length:381 start_codon:yes stop_codon:yes gene_type:complete
MKSQYDSNESIAKAIVAGVSFFMVSAHVSQVGYGRRWIREAYRTRAEVIDLVALIFEHPDYEEVHLLNVYPESDLDKPHEEYNPETDEYEKTQYSEREALFGYWYKQRAKSVNAAVTAIRDKKCFI